MKRFAAILAVFVLVPALAGGVRFGERGARQRVDRARGRLMAEQQLAAMHLEREHPGT